MKKSKMFGSLISIVLFASISSRANSADLYVITEGVGSQDGSVVRIAPTGTMSTIAASLSSPRGITADSQGNIFVGLGFEIDKISPYGNRTSLMGPDAYFSLEMDSSDILYASSSTHVDRLSPSGVFSTWATGLRNSGGMAFDGDGNLYMTDNLEFIYKYSPDGTRTIFASGLANPIDITIDSHGDLFVSALAANSIYKYTPAGVRSTFATGLINPWGLARDEDDNIYVSELTTGRITKISPAGEKSQFATGIVRPQFMVFYPQPSFVPEPTGFYLMLTAIAAVTASRRR